MIDRHTVSAFLKYKDKILILKRSAKVATYRGKWAVVHGRINPGEDPEKRARTEIEEELGIKNAKLLKKKKPFVVVDKQLDIRWHLYPFLFRVNSNKVKINWENSNFKWIKPEEIKKFDTVPGFYEEYNFLVNK